MIEVNGTIKQYFMLCKNCKALSFCLKTRDKYKKIKTEVSEEYNKAYKVFNGNMSGYDKLRNQQLFIDTGDRMKEDISIRKIIEILGDMECMYEKEIAQETLNGMHQKYDFETNPQIYNIAEQIVKLRIHDFRLAMAHKHYGVIRENAFKDLKLTPGLHYSVEISKEVANLVDKAENIVNGSKINLNSQEKWNNKLEEFKKYMIEYGRNDKHQ